MVQVVVVVVVDMHESPFFFEVVGGAGSLHRLSKQPRARRPWMAMDCTQEGIDLRVLFVVVATVDAAVFGRPAASDQ